MVTATPLGDLLAIEKLREQELEEARIIQGAMLPAQPLHVGSVVVSHEFQPVAEVGGDYLDYFALSDGTIGLYLGDVSGKGLPAALYAALAVGTLRGVHKTGMDPCRVLYLLNERLLLRGIPGRHSAIQYAVLPCVLGDSGIHRRLPAMGRYDRRGLSLFATLAARILARKCVPVAGVAILSMGPGLCLLPATRSAAGSSNLLE